MKKNLKIGVLFFIFFINQLSAILTFEEASDDFIETSSRDTKNYPWLAEYIPNYQTNNYLVAEWNKEPLIPKIIHQIWIGGEVPEKFKEMMHSWQEKHPDWVYKLWTDKDIESFEFYNVRQFKNAVNLGEKSDIWRYEILSKFGGVYLDIDYECLKSLDPLHHTAKFYASCAVGDGLIGNGVIGSIPNHPILIECMRKIHKLPDSKLGNPFKYTGPVLFNSVIYEFLKLKRPGFEKVSIYPNKFFHPFPSEFRYSYWKGEINKETVYSYNLPESFAIHYWANSWQN